jgi:hypothetical protein
VGQQWAKTSKHTPARAGPTGRNMLVNADSRVRAGITSTGPAILAVWGSGVRVPLAPPGEIRSQGPDFRAFDDNR